MLKNDVISFYKNNISEFKNESAEYIANQIQTNKLIPNTTNRTIAGWIRERRKFDKINDELEQKENKQWELFRNFLKNDSVS